MQTQLQQEVRFLTTRLGAIIAEQAGQDVFDRIEELRLLSKRFRRERNPYDLQVKRRLVSETDTDAAYAVAHAFSLFFQVVNLCEERARIRALQRQDAPRQSLRWMFRELAAAGIPAEKVAACLEELEIQPVLTAHPTEATRRSVLYQLWRLRKSIEQPDEILETLWQTEEVHHRKMTPIDEVVNAISFFDRSIFQTVADFYREFDEALEESYPGLRRTRWFLTFGSWVGGDRDGNPYVTPDVTREAVATHHRCVTRFYRRQCGKLVSELTHSVAPDSEFGEGQEITEGPFEPQEWFRKRAEDLADQIAQGEFTLHELRGTAESIQQGLRDQNAKRAADGRISDFVCQSQVFGLHLVELDFRDESPKLTDEPETVLEQMKTIRQLQEQYGPRTAHRYVLSMTHESNHLKSVLQFAKQAGLEQVDIVPLFETIDDLANSRQIMGELYADEEYRQHLAGRNDVQEVMVGYSDSSKDGGYLAANWLLRQAEITLADLSDSYGIKLQLFHGKGGSIDRGGGQSHESLRATPHAAHGGRIRITEQGEVISQKYSDPAIAQRNLEQLTSAVISAACLPPPDETHAERLPAWTAAMDQMAATSRAHYRDLVYETPEFLTYFRQATPIDIIERLRLGSRPASRKKTGKINQLRAIPWVFSWTQSRHFISAWYGIGAAVEQFQDADPGGLELLREMYRDWPFFQAVVDNAALSLAKTDMYIAGQYAALVEDERVREEIFGRIRGEYDRSVQAVLDVAEHERLLQHAPVLAESIELRNPYVDPLNFLQLEFLSRWRKEPDNEDEILRRLLALTVAGIASGMKSTG